MNKIVKLGWRLPMSKVWTIWLTQSPSKANFKKFAKCQNLSIISLKHMLTSRQALCRCTSQPYKVWTWLDKNWLKKYNLQFWPFQCICDLDFGESNRNRYGNGQINRAYLQEKAKLYSFCNRQLHRWTYYHHNMYLHDFVCESKTQHFKVKCSTRSGQGHTQGRISHQGEGGTLLLLLLLLLLVWRRRRRRRILIGAISMVTMAQSATN